MSLPDIPDLTPEEEARFDQLFKTLDVNNDGKIDVDDLSEALKTLQVAPPSGFSSREHAEGFFERSDKNRDGLLDFAEFVKYLHEHEKQLRLAFRHLDANEDGLIDGAEIIQSLKKLGVNIDEAEACRLVKKVDKDGTLKIDWKEFRDFFTFHPSSSVYDIVHHWRHSVFLDTGEDKLVPDDFTEKEMQTGAWWRHLLAGGAAGAVSRTCTAPFDRLKILLQVYSTRENRLGLQSGLRMLYAEGSLKGLWRGNGINVIKIAPESAMKFMAYEQAKRFYRSAGFCTDDGEITLLGRFLSGSTAGAISQTVIYPMEVVKTRLALGRTGEYNGILNCFHQVYKNEGPRSFFRGYVPNIIGIIPYAGIDLAIYETLKKLYKKRYHEGQDPSVLAVLACGTVSSTCGQLVSYPFALVRTKLQAKSKLGGCKDTMAGLFKSILKTEGFPGLYRGIVPNFLKVAPAVGISYIVYEKSRLYLGAKMS